VEGEVLAVGPGARDETGRLVPLDVETGDLVVFGKWTGPMRPAGAAGKRPKPARPKTTQKRGDGTIADWAELRVRL
jgi:hypothetical protein